MRGRFDDALTVVSLCAAIAMSYAALYQHSRRLEADGRLRECREVIREAARRLEPMRILPPRSK